jgi:hypothetical protein
VSIDFTRISHHDVRPSSKLKAWLTDELRALLAGLSIAKGYDASVRSGANYWLAQMDTSQAKRITFEEFYNNLCRLVKSLRPSKRNVCEEVVSYSNTAGQQTTVSS